MPLPPPVLLRYRPGGRCVGSKLFAPPGQVKGAWKSTVCASPQGMPPCQRLSPVAGPLTAVHQASQLPPINATRLHEITQLPTAGGRRLLRPRPTRGGWAGTSKHESGPHVAATRESLQGAMLLHQSAASKHSLSALACVVRAVLRVVVGISLRHSRSSKGATSRQQLSKEDAALSQARLPPCPP